MTYTLLRVSYLLHRLGFTSQIPAHRVIERNEHAIAQSRTATWANYEAAALTGAYVCFEDEAGQSLQVGKACTWARGRTPVARVCGKTGRLAVAGMACLKPGRPGPSSMAAGPPQAQGRPGSLCEDDYAHLITAAHHALGGSGGGGCCGGSCRGWRRASWIAWTLLAQRG